MFNVHYILSPPPPHSGVIPAVSLVHVVHVIAAYWLHTGFVKCPFLSWIASLNIRAVGNPSVECMCSVRARHDSALVYVCLQARVDRVNQHWSIRCSWQTCTAPSIPGPHSASRKPSRYVTNVTRVLPCRCSHIALVLPLLSFRVTFTCTWNRYAR